MAASDISGVSNYTLYGPIKNYAQPLTHVNLRLVRFTAVPTGYQPAFVPILPQSSCPPLRFRQLLNTCFPTLFEVEIPFGA